MANDIQIRDGNEDLTTIATEDIGGREFQLVKIGYGNVGSYNIDYYDIPLNGWVSTTFSPAVATFTTGSKYTIVDGRYIWVQKDATNRFYRFDPVKNEMDPGSQFLYPQGAAVVGDTCWDVQYVDGNTTITWIYMILNTSQVMLRMMIV